MVHKSENTLLIRVFSMRYLSFLYVSLFVLSGQPQNNFNQSLANFGSGCYRVRFATVRCTCFASSLSYPCCMSLRTSKQQSCRHLFALLGYWYYHFYQRGICGLFFKQLFICCLSMPFARAKVFHVRCARKGLRSVSLRSQVLEK
jgi:hypothetical protein